MLMSVKGWCGEENIWENWTCRMSGKGVGTLKRGGSRDTLQTTYFSVLL